MWDHMYVHRYEVMSVYISWVLKSLGGNLIWDNEVYIAKLFNVDFWSWNTSFSLLCLTFWPDRDDVDNKGMI